MITHYSKPVEGGGFIHPTRIHLPLKIDGEGGSDSLTISNPTAEHLAMLGLLPAEPLPGLAEGQKYGEPQLVDGVVGVEVVAKTVEDLDQTKLQAKQTLKQIRKTSLELWAGNGGVSAVYTENFQAAIAYEATDTAYRTKDGRTPADYLTRLGSLMGMTPQEFCDYIMWENSTNASPRMAQVEERYLALCYAGDVTNSITSIDDLATEVEVQQAITDYQTFCDTLWAETSPTFTRPEEP